MRSDTTSSSFVPVTGECTVEEMLARFPSTAPIFHELGFDTCSQAQTTLRQAAAVARTDLSVVLAMLEASAHASFTGTARR